ncbi:MAG: hypothetical protein JWM66_1603 [Solirubrobacterales bacterium]|nr:hypothetical protein [Solirubrobacterales bacterium]
MIRKAVALCGGLSACRPKPRESGLRLGLRDQPAELAVASCDRTSTSGASGSCG